MLATIVSIDPIRFEFTFDEASQILPEDAVGAIMRQSSIPGWSFYFRVPEIDAAKAKVESGGGTVHAGPMEVPGGDEAPIEAERLM